MFKFNYKKDSEKRVLLLHLGICVLHVMEILQVNFVAFGFTDFSKPTSSVVVLMC